MDSLLYSMNLQSFAQYSSLTSVTKRLMTCCLNTSTPFRLVT